MEQHLVPTKKAKILEIVLHPLRWSRMCLQAIFTKTKTSPADTAYPGVSKQVITLKHSFSTARRNVFKFSLEGILTLLVLASVVVNANASSSNFKPSLNEFVKYLAEHPDHNQSLTSLMETENIRVRPKTDNFVLAAQAATLDQAAADATLTRSEAEDSSSGNIGPLLTSVDGALYKPNYATIDAVARKEITEYVVQGGDSISWIAAEFGVSVPTILHENNLSAADYIKPGQTLKILPTTGIKHEVKEGETVSTIAEKYEVGLEIVLEYNGIEIPDDIHPGEVLIIPDGKIQLPQASQTRIASYSLVDVQRASVPQSFAGGTAFIWPLNTRNVTQYYWSRHRALDISNGQRPQFWASEAGVVELSGWQGAYGRTIVVNHGNGLQTRYAHASEIYVEAGDRVEKGQIIGRVGNTGRVYGATGNHIHFELIKNGVKLDPMAYLQ